ncbi:LysR family transcriptional regulator [Siculibacillus lacustris]|uniref:LysR family transcriptional regulator n=1 Tax=Siculibacillus lacustris TaxID=1549641 RepID=A0A4Q9VSE7_9HYPH|nr:LysR family transcriptional regulator [Siculibacillus lacustris]TBW38426.1 LysR family transcriptional regulator [Siculibacillus lacustris]
MVSLRLQLKISTDTRIGHGKVRLLEEIEVSGSISAAARVLGMNYRRAWGLIDHMNKAFGRPVVNGTTGSLGGAELTDLGRDIIARYRAMETEVLRIATPHVEAMNAWTNPGENDADLASSARSLPPPKD